MPKLHLYLTLVALDGTDLTLAERTSQRRASVEDVHAAISAAAREVYPLGASAVRADVPVTIGLPADDLALIAGCIEVGAEGLDGEVEPEILDRIWRLVGDLRTAALGVAP